MKREIHIEYFPDGRTHIFPLRIRRLNPEPSIEEKLSACGLFRSIYHPIIGVLLIKDPFSGKFMVNFVSDRLEEGVHEVEFLTLPTEVISVILDEIQPCKEGVAKGILYAGDILLLEKHDLIPFNYDVFEIR